MTRLSKFLRLSASDQRLLVEAALFHGMSRLALLALPFRWVASILGQNMQQTSRTVDPGHKEVAERVSWAVHVAGRLAPWKSTCLTEAIAAKLALRRRGIPSTLYLGAGRDENQKICYHAWLRSGDNIVAGGPLDKSYIVVATFAEQGK
jgi:hypothetical protein